MSRPTFKQLREIISERDELSRNLRLVLSDCHHAMAALKSSGKKKTRIKKAIKCLELALMDRFERLCLADSERLSGNIAAALAKQSPFVQILERL